MTERAITTLFDGGGFFVRVVVGAGGAEVLLVSGFTE